MYRINVGIDDGFIARYIWTSDVQGELHNGTETHFIRSDLSLGEHNITLRVMDGHWVWSDPVIRTITVRERPTAMIESITPNPALLNDTITFSAAPFDCRCGVITEYVWRSDRNGDLFTGEHHEFSTSGLNPGEHTIFLKVKDSYGIWSEEDSADLLMNMQPTAYITKISPNPVVENESVTFTGRGVDNDGTIERYRWGTGATELFNGSEPSFTSSSAPVGTHTIWLMVMDNDGGWSAKVNTTMVVTGFVPPNKKPMIELDTPLDGSKFTGMVKFSGTCADEDNETGQLIVAVQIGSELTENVSVDANGSWEVGWDTELYPNGDYLITAQCFDGEDYSEKVFVNITLENPDEDDDTSNWPLIGGIGFVVVMGGAIIAYFVIFNQTGNGKQD